jgi:hypothetical protein
MTELLDWTAIKKAEFRRMMMPYFDDPFNCELLKRPDYPATEQDRLNTIEASCYLLCEPDLDEEVIYSPPCRRCGAESGCRQLKEVMAELHPMTEEEKQDLLWLTQWDARGPRMTGVKIACLWPITDFVALTTRPATEYRLRGIAATAIDEVHEGLRGEVVIVGVAERISIEDVNTPIRMMRRDGRRLSGPTSMLNIYVHDDSHRDILAQIDRFNFERIAKPIIDHGRRCKPVWGFRGMVPSNFRMLRVTEAVLIGDMPTRR